ncbi:FAD binding domain-containing protein [Marinicella meishanensis]|uniref:FAD binding domain-containing protein n=1 Tax=Marinicella meishanensis TaxID=2873263 RepID=UPI001CBF00CA|nr:FAD binding domain-containing protein [Marinicella sp. NBU2979]
MTASRDHILIYLNGQRRELRGAEVFMTLSDYLRYERHLTGTKVVCAEGDCGACSVLVGAVKPETKADAVEYRVINACIQFMHGLDCCHIITIEGLPSEGDLHPVQSAMIKAQATQCGFCTPGFVMAAAGMIEHRGPGCQISTQQAKNYLTGNLCRCTGYLSIIQAMGQTDTQACLSIKDHYHPASVHQDLLQHTTQAVHLEQAPHRFVSPTTATAAAAALSDGGQVFAAATDLGVQHNKGHWSEQRAISLNLIPAMHRIDINDQHTRVGARVTLHALEEALAEVQPEWAQFMHIFASPQIKNNATLVGNVANGSPIGDNLPWLLALDATLTLQGPTQSRQVKLNDYYQGYKQFNRQEDELITHIDIPHRPAEGFLRLYKVSQRRDLDISCVSTAMLLTLDAEQRVEHAAIALGGVAATALRLPEFEQLLIGRSVTELTSDDSQQALGQQLAAQVKPLSDVRGSAAFRSQLVSNLWRKFMLELGDARAPTPEAKHGV